MSQSYRIETLGHFSTYGDSTKGDFLVTVAGDSRELRLFHDTSSNYEPPTVGDEFPGEIVQGKRGEWRLKRASRGGGSSSSSAGGSRQGDGPGLTWKSAPYERGAEHPRNEARMIHTSALSAAPAFINQALAFGVIKGPKDEDGYWKLVGHVAGKLVKSYEGALRATEGPPQPVQPQLNGGEVPADVEGLQPTATVADESIAF